MRTLRLILGDQLSHSISSLADLDSTNDLVLMVEAADETTYVHHHQQKIILVLSAMRHFAAELRTRGVNVDYVKLGHEGNTGSFISELNRAVIRHAVDQIVITEPGEWRVQQMFDRFRTECGLPVEILPDHRFLCSRDEFNNWTNGRKSLRMEHFYRYMRQKTGWLMEGSRPAGGQWNYDSQNREALPASLVLPARSCFTPDVITREVITMVRSRFCGHFGDAEPFRWAVTRADALAALQEFIDCKLFQFGNYQDAMKTGEDMLFHSTLSAYLNIGLLEAKEVCEAALAAYQKGDVPLSSVEGFVRQILGWREFVRGIYWLKMPDYGKSNFFYAGRPLPDFYWTGETEMKCLQEAIRTTRQHAYAHHIQRLMVTGNFALLAGIDPVQVDEWYLSVYIDAFEWVELPNTHGMALHADGGIIGSKPYAASGAYIKRMSDYCSGCSYDPGIKLGSRACPFNYLYWNFLIINQAQLQSNPRMALIYRNLERMPPEQRDEIFRSATDFLQQFSE
ncbi:MAG: cryptochrome/photolyase family protein [Anaerolineae bacterium]|jgi:deoxyribodipyrimidine photolyase-related protein|nr:cryptochrome/photolyase family protein [Anaerolineae bacterium]